MPKKKNWAMPPEALQLVAERFKILAEPIRLRILQSLEAGELSVNEVTTAVESTQPNVSKHLKILQDAGIIARRQEGNTVFYRIADESIFQLCELVCASLKERYASRSAIFG
jgi:DNA-binding transcriptional ArsR family regulator